MFLFSFHRHIHIILRSEITWYILYKNCMKILAYRKSWFWIINGTLQGNRTDLEITQKHYFHKKLIAHKSKVSREKREISHLQKTNTDITHYSASQNSTFQLNKIKPIKNKDPTSTTTFFQHWDASTYTQTCRNKK